jgi:hypothetical protein
MVEAWLKILLYALFILVIALVLWIVVCQLLRYHYCVDCGRRSGRHRKNCSYKQSRWKDWFKGLFCKRKKKDCSTEGGGNGDESLGEEDFNSHTTNTHTEEFEDGAYDINNGTNNIEIVQTDDGITNAPISQLIQSQVRRQCCLCTIGNEYLTCLETAGSNGLKLKCCRDNYNKALRCCETGNNPAECHMQNCFVQS